MNFFTELKEGLSISWGAIRANKMRSILTTLGIVIGIVTVTLMGTAIEGLNRAFVNSISYIGADVLYLERFDWFNDTREGWMRMRARRKFTLRQIEALERQLTLAGAVAPVAQDTERVSYKRRHSDFVNITGSNEEFLQTSSVTMAQGRFLSAPEIQGARPVCVIGSDVASNLFLSEPPVGAKVLIDDKQFEVVGVLEKQGGLLDGGGIDNQIIVPLKQFISAFWSRPDFEIQVKVKDLKELEDAKEETRGVFRKIRHLKPNEADDFSINQQEQVLDMFHKVAGTIAAIGLFITGLSLFVGGIGIMNIMFVSVAERTREIGIRKAIGAKRRTILVQFLIEAATICLIGGLLGLSLAWPLTLVVRKFMPAVMSPLIVSIAILVSLVTGVISGFLPAWRAARMNPVDALRSGE